MAAVDDIRAASIEDVMENEEWSIKDDHTAEWALRQIRKAKDEMDRVWNDAAFEIDYYQKIQEAAETKFSNSTGFLRGKLLEYFGTVAHQETKTQESYKLPSGTLVQKKAKLDLEHDDETLLRFLKESGDTEYIKVTEKVAWGDLKKALTMVDGAVVNKETGEVVEGVTIIEKPEQFEIKL